MENISVHTSYRHPEKNAEAIAWHWYDFTCPFCYVSSSRNKMLEANGYNVIALPFQAHPDVPAEGLLMRERKGTMHELLEKEAQQAKLPLRWPARLPNTRYALALAEQVRRHIPRIFQEVKNRVDAAHFVLNEDLGSEEVVNHCLMESGVEDWEIRTWVQNGAAFRDLELSHNSARRAGVNGTPAWILNDQLIFGLQSPSYFLHVMS